MTQSSDELTDWAALIRLAGIKSTKNDAKPVGLAQVFDAGNVEEMRKLLAKYKVVSGDHTPSHVFELDGQLWVATAVVVDPRESEA